MVVPCLLVVYAVYIVVIAQRTEPPDPHLYDTPAQDICQLLIDTDKKLVDKYLEKSTGQGEEIMSLLREYNDNLAILVKRLVKENTANDTLSTLAESQPLINHGGPGFINLYIDRVVLEKDFALNNISSRIILAQRQNCVDLWQDFFKWTSKIPDEDGESIEY